MARPLDWRTCPLCGEQDWEVHSEERLYAANRLTFTLEAGRLTKAEFGLCEPYWDTCTTMFYVAGCCGEQLPERYQQALDTALENFRQVEE